MKTTRNLTAIVALILFAGCGTATDSTSPAPVGNTDASFSSTMVVKAEDSQGYKPQGAEIANAMNEAGTRMRELTRQYHAGDITAEYLSKEADKIVAEHTQNPIVRTVIPQLVSHAALSALLESKNPEAIKPQIAHHTQALVATNSPHAEEVARALEVLGDYWTSEEIETAANKAVDNAEYYLARPAHKMDQASQDQPDNEVPLEELQDSRSRAKADIGSGIKQLEAILER
ncbi:MAG: hypothetical protein F4Y00_06810 [Bacteroidetes bacterium SB0662_bin_6]|nr:hypothetical protein [Bacteroidetes bacterium SB0662_bin_6]